MAVYAHINTVPYGSTGGIMLAEHHDLLVAGEESYVFWGRGRASACANEMRVASDIEVKIDALRTRLDGRAGFHSKRATIRLLSRLEEIQPDVVHLHNLHGYYVNVEMLFEWLAAHECCVEWTLHDCWPFTGHCVHFTYVKCTQWRAGCASSVECPQLRTYPKCYCKDSCSWNYEQKKRIFNLIPAERMKLITPSKWLADLVSNSFLKKYPIEVRHNTVDTSIFRSRRSDFRRKYGIGDRFMVLGVANPWTERKGLGDFIRLSEQLDNAKYVVVLVGLSRKQIKQLSKRIIALPKTENMRQLAEIYSAADVFVHPGVEETFGLTVAEAQACGTPVIVTEGSACAEIADPKSAFIVPADLSTLKATIVGLSEAPDGACY